MDRTKVIEVLKQVEWGSGLGIKAHCRACSGWEGMGHREDCKLAALLDSLADELVGEILAVMEDG